MNAKNKSSNNALYKYALTQIADPVHSGAYGDHKPVVGASNIFKGTTEGKWADLENWQDLFEMLTGVLNSTEILFGADSNRTNC